MDARPEVWRHSPSRRHPRRGLGRSADPASPLFVAPPTPGGLPQPIRRWLLIILASVLIGYVLYRNQATLVLLGLSFVVAYLLDPSVDRLERLGLSRTLAITLLAGLLCIVIGVLFLVVIPQLRRQALLVADRAPRWGPWLYDHLAPLLEQVAVPLSEYFGIALDIDSLKMYAVRLWDWVMSHLPGITFGVLSVFQTMFTGLANFIVGVLNILLVPVLIFYLLRDFDALHARFYTLLPPHWRPIVADWLGEVDQAVGGFLRGQFTIALVLATLYAIGLALLGVPLGVVLGIISGLANLVPYMSIVVGLIPALLLFLLSDAASFGGVLSIILLYVGGQLLEGVYLSPRIMGRETGLHPVVVMVAILVGGTLFGLVGIILAVPAAAVLQVVLRRWHRAWQATWPPLERTED
jgi:predicted PurR-regulated permease PerM